MGVDQDPRAAAAALRLGHLRRRRIDPRAHPRDRRADPRGNLAHAGRASDLRRRDAATRSTRSPAIIGSSASATSSRCAAIRPSRARSYRPHPDGYRNAAELVAGLKAVAPFDISVAAYPEIHPDSPIAAVRPRQSQAQGRRRRRPRDHAILLLARLLLPLPRRGRGGRHRRRDRPGHPAGLERRHDAPLRRSLRRDHSGLARRAVRRARRPARGAPADRRDRRRRAVRPALCRRRPPLPLLHAQPRRAQLRDLPSARRQGESDDAPHRILPRRSRQAHPDQGRRLRHRDPGREAARAPIIAAAST